MQGCFTFSADGKNYFFKVDEVSDMVESATSITVFLKNGRHYAVKDVQQFASLKSKLELPFVEPPPKTAIGFS